MYGVFHYKVKVNRNLLVAEMNNLFVALQYLANIYITLTWQMILSTIPIWNLKIRSYIPTQKL